MQRRKINSCVIRAAGAWPPARSAFPESWYSWRHQLEALAKQGFRANAVVGDHFSGSDLPTNLIEPGSAIGSDLTYPISSRNFLPASVHRAKRVLTTSISPKAAMPQLHVVRQTPRDCPLHRRTWADVVHQDERDQEFLFTIGHVFILSGVWTTMIGSALLKRIIPEPGWHIWQPRTRLYG